MEIWLIPIISLFLGILGGWGAVGFRLGKYAQRVDDFKERITTVEREMKNLSTKIVECITKIDERTSSYAGTLLERKSPITLSEEGSNLLKRSGADKFVLEHKDELVEKIKDKNPKSAYDVQELANKVVETLADDERIIDLKNFAFQERINISVIFMVMGIYLRDIALAVLGYKPEDVDQSDPHQ